MVPRKRHEPRERGLAAPNLDRQQRGRSCRVKRKITIYIFNRPIIMESTKPKYYTQDIARQQSNDAKDMYEMCTKAFGSPREVMASIFMIISPPNCSLSKSRAIKMI